MVNAELDPGCKCESVPQTRRFEDLQYGYGWTVTVILRYCPACGWIFERKVV